MKKNIVTIYSLLWDVEYISKRERWFVERKEVFSYQTEEEGESAAEQAFHLTNATGDYLTEEDRLIISENFSPDSSLTVKTGDIIKVESTIRGTDLPSYYLCKSFGWEKFKGDRIQLIKHLLW